MKKITLSLCLLAASTCSSLVMAHPECTKKEFWDNTPDNCITHTLVGAEEKHIVYFDFDKSEVGDVQDITDYISSLKELNTITLIGHADRIGSDDYNDALSKSRVDAVEQKLIDSGVDSAKISTDYKGEKVPAQTCEGDFGPELIECLHANRRVEIEIVGEKVIEQHTHN
ncbi:MAG: OmpA family protein [Neptuniibacter sp.]